MVRVLAATRQDCWGERHFTSRHMRDLAEDGQHHSYPEEKRMGRFESITHLLQSPKPVLMVGTVHEQDPVDAFLKLQGTVWDSDDTPYHSTSLEIIRYSARTALHARPPLVPSASWLPFQRKFWSNSSQKSKILTSYRGKQIYLQCLMHILSTCSLFRTPTWQDRVGWPDLQNSKRLGSNATNYRYFKSTILALIVFSFSPAYYWNIINIWVIWKSNEG